MYTIYKKETIMLKAIKSFICPENDADMITPKLIKISYMIEVIVACIAVVPAFIYFACHGKIVAMLCTPLVFVSIILASKIICEVLMLTFRINENLKKIAENTKK
jgi:hypothetical protein